MMRRPYVGLFLGTAVASVVLAGLGIFVAFEALAPLSAGARQDLVGLGVAVVLCVYVISVWLVAGRRLGRFGVSVNLILAGLVGIGSVLLGAFFVLVLIGELNSTPAECGVLSGLAGSAGVLAVLGVGSIAVSQAYCVRMRRAG